MYASQSCTVQGLRLPEWTRQMLWRCAAGRGLVVVGSPATLSSDGIWRAWLRWVRDHGAFATANALPLCPWEQVRSAPLALQQTPHMHSTLSCKRTMHLQGEWPLAEALSSTSHVV